jgi:hypothetical protein
MPQPFLSLPQLKLEVNRLAQREVGVEETLHGKFICKFVDFSNPHPSQLLGDTEEIAYSNLLSYLQNRSKSE